MSAAAASVLRVIAPGLSTTIQDRGRPGFQRYGVPVCGALDPLALAAANIVAGNAPSEAALECLYQGCELEAAAQSVRLAVAGAGAALEIVAGGEVVRRVQALESVTTRWGERVRVRIAGPSISACLAVEGGIAVPAVLGSRSTFVRARLGGLDGRVLRTGDLLPLARAEASDRDEMRLPDVDLAPAEGIRVVLGPQADRFTAAAIETLTSSVYTVRPASDRMGLRLDGPRLAHTRGADIVSDGIAPGTIQVPGDGLPIVMLADRQTTGGYTKIATVISADLPALGRVGPRAELRFQVVDVDAAEAAARAVAAEIAGWAGRLATAGDLAERLARLHHVNLISGVIDGRSPG